VTARLTRPHPFLLRLGQAAALISAALSCAAWTTGDFGRPRSLFGEDQFWPPTILGFPLTPPAGAPVFAMEPTDDEKVLRKLAYNLLVPPYEGELWRKLPIEVTFGSVLEYDGPPYDYHAYAGALMTLPVRSTASRWSRLIDDIRNDMLRMEEFFAVAYRVVDMDQKRERSLAYIKELSPAEVAAVHLRMGDNARIIARVRLMLGVRAKSYRFALERLVILAPSPVAVDVERLLVTFEAAVATAQGAVVVGAPLVTK
jgi:hypothetical protein